MKQIPLVEHIVYIERSVYSERIKKKGEYTNGRLLDNGKDDFFIMVFFDRYYLHSNKKNQI